MPRSSDPESANTCCSMCSATSELLSTAAACLGKPFVLQWLGFGVQLHLALCKGVGHVVSLHPLLCWNIHGNLVAEHLALAMQPAVISMLCLARILHFVYCIGLELVACRCNGPRFH
jgi:hypothetical protein